jgi:hypothetical protein
MPYSAEEPNPRCPRGGPLCRGDQLSGWRSGQASTSLTKLNLGSCMQPRRLVGSQTKQPPCFLLLARKRPPKKTTYCTSRFREETDLSSLAGASSASVFATRGLDVRKEPDSPYRCKKGSAKSKRRKKNDGQSKMGTQIHTRKMTTKTYKLMHHLILAASPYFR